MREWRSSQLHLYLREYAYIKTKWYIILPAYASNYQEKYLLIRIYVVFRVHRSQVASDANEQSIRFTQLMLARIAKESNKFACN